MLGCLSQHGGFLQLSLASVEQVKQKLAIKNERNISVGFKGKAVNTKSYLYSFLSFTNNLTCAARHSNVLFNCQGINFFEICKKEITETHPNRDKIEYFI